MKHLTDSQLVDAYINGNESAFELLLRRHTSAVFNYIYHKVNDQELAEDIFQDTFMKVVLTLKEGRYNDEGKFVSWVTRIAHNLIIDHFRYNNKVKKVSETSYENEEFSIFDILSDPDKSVEDTMIWQQIESDVVKLIEYLPKDQKEILEMRLFQCMSFKDISESLNLSINTCLGRMRYAVLNLRKLIQKHNIVLH